MLVYRYPALATHGMNARRINWEYLNLYQEIPLFCALSLHNLFRAKARQTTGRLLIVNTCLIGEFAASLPAIRDFIMRHDEYAVDLMVAPPLAPLAKRVRGVRNVYTARSLYGRAFDKEHSIEHALGAYDRIFVMRISVDVYRRVRAIAAGEIHTGLWQYISYALHLWGSLLQRRMPKQWRELNFEMLGGTPKDVPFDEIFDFAPDEYASVKKLDALQTTDTKVTIHTGSSWPMKHWSTGRWVALLRRAHELGGLRFIFVGGNEDEKDFESISAQLPFPVYSLVGQIDLLQLLLVLRASNYFIGVDSGPRNLAHLAGVRSVCIFGPGPHFYMPTDPRDVVIDKSRGRGLFQMFVRTKRGFINQISPDEVFEGFKRLVG